MSDQKAAEQRRSARVMLWPVRAGIAGLCVVEILLLKQLVEAMQLGGFRGNGWWQWGFTFGGLMLALWLLFAAHKGLKRMAQG
jgi:hypothetical protein